MPDCTAGRSVESGRSQGMSPDQYRAKAEELKAKSQGDYSPIDRAVFGGLARSYHRLARLEEEHQLEVRQKARNRSLETGRSIEQTWSLRSANRGRMLYESVADVPSCVNWADENLISIPPSLRGSTT